MSDSTSRQQKKWPWIALFCALTIAFLALGYVYYRGEMHSAKERQYQELHTIAELKTRQIQEWRRERIAGLQILVQSSYFAEAVEEFVGRPDSKDSESRLRQRLMVVRNDYRYQNALLVGLRGEVLVSVKEESLTLDPTARRTVEDALSSRRAVFGDFYRCSICGQIHIDAAAPILREGDRPVAVLVFRLDPEADLFPLIRSWSTPSKTAETLLVRKEGDHVLFLNELRHRPNTALKLREPLTRMDLPAARAVLGKHEHFEGKDYRGVRVLAHTRPVPDSPWFMVAKVDADEMLAEVHKEAWIISLLVVMLIILAGVGTGLVFVSRQKNLYADLYLAEKERAEAREELRATLYSIGDAVITTDTGGHVRHMNRVAEGLTGWSEAETLGCPLHEVFHIVNEETREEVEDPVQRVLREGTVVGLANHTLLIAKDGTERPIADSGAPICDERGEIIGVVLVFRDQTEERAGARERRESERRYRDLWEKAPVMMFSLDLEARINFVSDHSCEHLGYERDEVLGRRPFEFQTAESAHYAQCVVFPAFLRTGSVKDAPLQYVKKNGEIIDVLLNVTAERDAQGAITRSRSVLTDITERKKLEVTSLETARRLQLAVNAGNVGLWDWDLETNKVFYSREWKSQIGYEEHEISNTFSEWESRVHPDDLEKAVKNVRDYLDKPWPDYVNQFRFRHKDGSYRWIRAQASLLRDINGKPVRMLGCHLDINEQKLSEQAIRESEERYRSLFENMSEGYAYCRMVLEDGKPEDFAFLRVNNAFEKLTGLKNVVGKKVTTVIPGIKDSNPELFQIYGRVASTGESEKFETYVYPLGAWLSISVYSMEREHFVAVFDNITERKKMEQALRESEKKYRSLFEESTEAILIVHGEGEIVDANQSASDLLAVSREDLIGQNTLQFYENQADRTAFREIVDRDGVMRDFEFRIRRRDGSLRYCLMNSSTWRDDKGARIGYMSIIRDVTKQRRSEEAQRRLATAIDQSGETVIITNSRGRIEYVNPAFEQMTGYSSEEVSGRDSRFLRGDADRSRYQILDETIGRGAPWQGRFMGKRKDRALFELETTITPIKDSAGAITNLVVVGHDVTQRIQLETQLIQAQKMESVGTLAGGIAHDFNNLLTVILGYSELLLMTKNKGAPGYSDLQAINSSALRGAELVRQLLTFSRRIETEARPLDLNNEVKNAQKLLFRTIPKMIDIQLALADDLKRIKADQGQMEQILLNLAINAKDAMPDGGTLVIGTRNIALDQEYVRTRPDAKPGDHVLLTVSDTGHGMVPELVERIFEPFYSTKKPGEGTGLGLAMVFGIVKGHGGHITCDSEPGVGTTFNIYLPVIEVEERAAAATVEREPTGGTEIILLVDDEALIRELGERILGGAGYTVLTAGTGKEALEIYREKHSVISLVILDLIMPEMGGKECLGELLKMDPNVRVIIASGFAADRATKETIDAHTGGLVRKPFERKRLLGLVREVLDKD